MEQEELLAKLAVIEEQAELTLYEFPKSLTKERLRTIILLARELRGLARHPDPRPAAA